MKLKGIFPLLACLLLLAACGAAPADRPAPAAESKAAEQIAEPVEPEDQPVEQPEEPAEEVAEDVPAETEKTENVPDEGAVVWNVHNQPASMAMLDSSISPEQRWMAGEALTVRSLPLADANVTRTVSYQLVDILSVQYVLDYNVLTTEETFQLPEDDLWALVAFACGDSSLDSVGWVRAADLTAYTEETRDSLLFPLTLRPGAVDLDTGEVLDGLGDMFLQEAEDGYAVVSWIEGGGHAERHRVSWDDVIYPPVDGEDTEMAESPR